MKVGDMVRSILLRDSVTGTGEVLRARRAGVVTDFEDRKCWRVAERGKKINWGAIDPEQHAVVLFDNGTMRIPVIDLEVVENENAD